MVEWGTTHAAGARPRLGRRHGPAALELGARHDRHAAGRPPGAYGHAPAATPALDRLAREGVLVEDAAVQVPQTRPSHASILTGRLPYEHGIRDNDSPPLEAACRRSPRPARARGIGTGPSSAPTRLAPPRPRSRLRRFDDPFGAGRARRPRHATERRRRRSWTPPWAGWRPGSGPSSPGCTSSTRMPLRAARAFARASRRALRRRGGLRGRAARRGCSTGWTRAGLRGTHARRRDVRPRRGPRRPRRRRAPDLHLRLDPPCAAASRRPGTLPAGARVAGQFRSVDLLPTLLDLLGQAARAPAARRGRRSCAAGAAFPTTSRTPRACSAQLHFGYAPLRALRAEGWKYIDAPRAELYRPRRRSWRDAQPRSTTRAQVAAGCARLASYDKGGAGAPAPWTPSAPSAWPRSATSAAAPGPAPGRADPKDKLAEFQEFQSYRRDVVTAPSVSSARTTPRGAIRPLTRLARATTPTRTGRSWSATRSTSTTTSGAAALLQAGRALRTPSRPWPARWRSPPPPPRRGRTWRTRIAGPAGWREAVETVRRGLARVPDNPRADRDQRADPAAKQVDVALARTDPREGAPASLPTTHACAWTCAATCTAIAGQLEAARVEAQQALRLPPPDSAEAAGRLGVWCSAPSGREAEAGDSLPRRPAASRPTRRTPSSISPPSSYSGQGGPRRRCPCSNGSVLPWARPYPGAGGADGGWRGRPCRRPRRLRGPCTCGSSACASVRRRTRPPGVRPRARTSRRSRALSPSILRPRAAATSASCPRPEDLAEPLRSGCLRAGSGPGERRPGTARPPTRWSSGRSRGRPILALPGRSPGGRTTEGCHAVRRFACRSRVGRRLAPGPSPLRRGPGLEGNRSHRRERDRRGRPADPGGDAQGRVRRARRRHHPHDGQEGPLGPGRGRRLQLGLRHRGGRLRAEADRDPAAG